MSGPREGVAYITFTTNADSSGLNFTFNGYQVMVPKNHEGEEFKASRNNADDATRTGFVTDPGKPDGTQIFGSQPIEGPWNFDTKGQVIGHFVETSEVICNTNVITLTEEFFASTNQVAVTNEPDANNIFCATFPVFDSTNTFTGTNGRMCFSNSISCSALTNAISFVGKVVPGKRLTLTTSTPFGKVVYRGVPARDLSDISGSWSGAKKQDLVVYNEFFAVERSMLHADIPNVYFVTGAGPAYSYFGHAILSSQKKIAFSFGLADPNGVPSPDGSVRAAIGPFDSKKFSFKAHGWEQPGGTLNSPVKFNGTRLSPF
jgi:hypothetical protein